MKRFAFIIGNGPSRKDFDLEVLRNLGVIFGTNALYRDFEPDFLVAIDEPIILEIEASSFPKDRFIVPPLQEQYEPVEFNPVRPRNNAGLCAMNEAIKRGFKDLVCLGMDFILREPSYNLGNIYANTECYDETTKADLNDTINRCRYFDWYAAQNRSVNFKMLFPHQNLSFRTISASNVCGQTFDNFLAKVTDDNPTV